MKIRCALPKWVERPHYRFEADLLGRDGYGTWLGCPPGTPFEGPESPGVWNHGFVILVPSGQWWLISYQGEGEPQNLELYVDITMPAEWPNERTCRAIDLDLDVARYRDGRVALLDEDEFEERRVAYGYPDEIVRRATETAHSVLELVREGREPFGTVGARWLAELA